MVVAIVVVIVVVVVVARDCSPPLDRGRCLVAEELHRGLISDTLKALQESRDPVGALVAEDIFRDPRWTKVKCSERSSAWGRLLSRLGLESSLTRVLASLHSDSLLNALISYVISAR